MGGNLGMQSLQNGFRGCFYELEQDQRGAFGPSSALLPVLQGVHADSDHAGKLGLRSAQLQAQIFDHYRGTILQTLPPYSAKKIQGRPLYSYARKGIELSPTQKEVTIKALKVISLNGCEVEFELTCTAGTYARSLAHDIGSEYGCGAHLIRLRRTRSGEFPIAAAVPLNDGEQFYSREFFIDRVIPMRSLLHEIPSIVVSDGDRMKIIHGMDLNLLAADWKSDEYRLIDQSGELIALANRVQTFTAPVEQPAHWIRIHPHLIFSE